MNQKAEKNLEGKTVLLENCYFGIFYGRFSGENKTHISLSPAVSFNGLTRQDKDVFNKILKGEYDCVMPNNCGYYINIIDLTKSGCGRIVPHKIDSASNKIRNDDFRDYLKEINAE
jgi:hypothetical protein